VADFFATVFFFSMVLSGMRFLSHFARMSDCFKRI
jgi:hypothetical protein